MHPRMFAEASPMHRRNIAEHRETPQMIRDVCSPKHRRTIPDIVSNGTGKFLHRETSGGLGIFDIADAISLSGTEALSLIFSFHSKV